jgi:hypothetical protein
MMLSHETPNTNDHTELRVTGRISRPATQLAIWPMERAARSKSVRVEMSVFSHPWSKNLKKRNNFIIEK